MRGRSPSRLAWLGLATLLLGIVGSAWSWSIRHSPAFGLLADQAYHLALAEEYDHAWRAGEIPPRWAAGMNGGRGGPVFVIYPPFFAFLTTSLARLTSGLREALGAAVLLVALATFWAVYYLARGWLSPLRSLPAAALVLLLPGTTMIALGRGLYPNFAALLWVALAAGAAQRMIFGRGEPRNTAVLAFSLAGLLLTHALTAFLGAMITAATLPVIWKRLPKCVCLRFLGAGAAAMLLTVWFWLPLLQAGAYTRIEYLEASHPYRQSTLWGTAPEKTAYEKDWALLNLVGKSIVVGQSLLALALWLVLQSKFRQPKQPNDSLAPLAGGNVFFLDLLPWVAGFCLAVSLDPIATWLVKLPRFGLVQFSWRWQLFVALWCGVSLASLPRRTASLFPATLAIVVLLFFSPLLSPAGARPEEIPPDLPHRITKERLDAMPAMIRAAYRSNSLELRPRGADWFHYLPAPYGRVEVVTGAAAVKSVTLQPSRREYQVDAASRSILRVVTYHCPGWTAHLNSNPVEIRTEQGTGLQLIDVPAGRHRLELNYEAPW